MKYLEKSFTVPASAGSASYCAEHGHTLPDVRGQCLRCSAKVRAAEVVNQWPAVPELACLEKTESAKPRKWGSSGTP